MMARNVPQWSLSLIQSRKLIQQPYLQYVVVGQFPCVVHASWNQTKPLVKFTNGTGII